MLDFKISKKGLDNVSVKKYYTVCTIVHVLFMAEVLSKGYQQLKKH